MWGPENRCCSSAAGLEDLGAAPESRTPILCLSGGGSERFSSWGHCLLQSLQGVTKARASPSLFPGLGQSLSRAHRRRVVALLPGPQPQARFGGSHRGRGSLADSWTLQLGYRAQQCPVTAAQSSGGGGILQLPHLCAQRLSFPGGRGGPAWTGPGEVSHHTRHLLASPAFLCSLACLPALRPHPAFSKGPSSRARRQQGVCPPPVAMMETQSGAGSQGPNAGTCPGEHRRARCSPMLGWLVTLSWLSDPDPSGAPAQLVTSNQQESGGGGEVCVFTHVHWGPQRRADSSSPASFQSCRGPNRNLAQGPEQPQL